MENETPYQDDPKSEDPARIELPEVFPPPTPVLLAPSQQAAFEQIKRLATVYFSTSWHHLPYRPRLTPLIVGPSGSGKSFLASFIAKVFGASFIRVGYGEWHPSGARSASAIHTLDRIHRLLAGSCRCVILVDELDKMGVTGGLEWTNCITQELFVLLDRDPVITSSRASWDHRALLALRRQTFLIGAGTWQSVWDAPKRPAFHFDFDETPSPEIVAQRIEAEARIPQELLKRFDGDLVVIGHYTEHDYQSVLSSHNAHVPPDLRIDVTPELLTRLVEGRRNMRGVQELIGQRLMQRAKEAPDSLESDIPF